MEIILNNKTKAAIRILDILEAKNKYHNGENISEFLRSKLQTNKNTSEIIEVVYDFQAGEYISNFKKNPTESANYSRELAEILDHHITCHDTLLDIGCGELTTISLVLSTLNIKPKKLLAFDISWSRIFNGCDFAREMLSEDNYKRIIPFVSDIAEIPLKDNSIDITTSSFALYSSHGRLKELLNELFRITKVKILLFEPCYEIASSLGKKRMDELKYIRNIEETVKELGGTLVQRLILKNNANSLTPGACYVIHPPKNASSIENLTNQEKEIEFSIPGTNYQLKKIDNFYISLETGLCFPILKSIPILRNKSAILASALNV